MKKFDYLGWIILLSIFVSTYYIHKQFTTVRYLIENSASEIPLIKITDNQQFSQLCDQLITQWGAQGYSLYLLQPKSSLKTHKAKAACSISCSEFPLRTELSPIKYQKQLIENRYLSINSDELSLLLFNTSLDTSHDFLVLPIYQNTIIIGEFYVAFEKGTVNQMSKAAIENYILEAQVLSQLLY